MASAVTESSEASQKQQESIAKDLKNKSFENEPSENQDLEEVSEEEPPFDFGYRARPRAPAAGSDVRSDKNSNRPTKQGGSKLKDDQLDELDIRAKRAKDTKKN